MVVMDLSSSYRNIVRKCFPNANIVADHFHVIRMISHHFMEFCRQAQEVDTLEASHHPSLEKEGLQLEGSGKADFARAL